MHAGGPVKNEEMATVTAADRPVGVMACGAAIARMSFFSAGARVGPCYGLRDRLALT